jgi:hypothetical protein
MCELYFMKHPSVLQSKNNTSASCHVHFRSIVGGKSVTIIKAITRRRSLVNRSISINIRYRPNNVGAHLSVPPIICNRSSSTIDLGKARGLSGRFEGAAIIKWNNDAIGRQQKCFSVRDLESQRKGNL